MLRWVVQVGERAWENGRRERGGTWVRATWASSGGGGGGAAGRRTSLVILVLAHICGESVSRTGMRGGDAFVPLLARDDLPHHFLTRPFPRRHVVHQLLIVDELSPSHRSCR